MNIYDWTITIFSNDKTLNEASTYFVKLGDKFILNKPINEKLRNKTAKIITLHDTNLAYKLVWNFIPPIIIIFAFWIISLFKKQREYFLLLSSIIGKVFIIIMTAPAPLFMYYMSFYLIGYTLLLYTFVWITGKILRFKRQLTVT